MYLDQYIINYYIKVHLIHLRGCQKIEHPSCQLRTYITYKQFKMGFDWHIYLHTRVDEETGLPVVGWFPSVPYNPQEYIVPEKYREFLTMRNGILHTYTKEAEEDTKRYELEVMELLGYFPEWEAVTREWDDIELDDWTHEKHCLFKEALEWFASKQCFVATWSH
jgi:hypothetical protein